MPIRRATPADLAAILRIAHEGFVGDDTLSADWLIEKLSEPGTTLTVDDAGAGCVRGFLLVQKYAPGTIIRLIAVGSQFRGLGIGRGLLKSVKGRAGAWVRRENKASRAMFSGAGWSENVPDWSEAKKPATHSGRWVYYARE